MAEKEHIPKGSDAPLDTDHEEHNDHEEHSIGNEIRRLQKIKALLIAIQFAAEHDAEFDVPDALAGVLALIEHSLTALDQTEASQEVPNGHE